MKVLSIPCPDLSSGYSQISIGSSIAGWNITLSESPVDYNMSSVPFPTECRLEVNLVKLESNATGSFYLTMDNSSIKNQKMASSNASFTPSSTIDAEIDIVFLNSNTSNFLRWIYQYVEIIYPR